MKQNLYPDNVTHAIYYCEIDAGEKKTSLRTLKKINAELFKNISKISTSSTEISQTNYLQKCHLKKQFFHCR